MLVVRYTYMDNDGGWIDPVRHPTAADLTFKRHCQTEEVWSEDDYDRRDHGVVAKHPMNYGAMIMIMKDLRSRTSMVGNLDLLNRRA